MVHVLRVSKCPAQVSDYKVKVMIAEPKGKRGRRDPLFSEAFAHAIQQPGLEYGTSHLGPYSAMSEPPVRLAGAVACISGVRATAAQATARKFWRLHCHRMTNSLKDEFGNLPGRRQSFGMCRRPEIHVTGASCKRLAPSD